MTDRRIRDFYLLLIVEAEPYGATVRVERTNGDHLKGISLLVSTRSSSSPRSRRAAFSATGM
jgi:hypothetical protein